MPITLTQNLKFQTTKFCVFKSKIPLAANTYETLKGNFY